MKLKPGSNYELVWAGTDGSSDVTVISDEGDGWYYVTYESGLGAGRKFWVNLNQMRLIAPA
jgi:uncharacterized protein YgiM (DUF1202 family)